MRAAAATSSTARSNAAAFAFDGALKPLSFLTNCNDASRISASVAGGSKLKSVRIFLHVMVSHDYPIDGSCSFGVFQNHMIVKDLSPSFYPLRLSSARTSQFLR